METTIRAIASAAVACYVAGLMVGTWVHRLNDRLARHWVCWWGQAQPAAPGGETECLPAAAALAPIVSHPTMPPRRYIAHYVDGSRHELEAISRTALFAARELFGPGLVRVVAAGQR